MKIIRQAVGILSLLILFIFLSKLIILKRSLYEKNVWKLMTPHTAYISKLKHASLGRSMIKYIKVHALICTHKLIGL